MAVLTCRFFRGIRVCNPPYVTKTFGQLAALRDWGIIVAVGIAFSCWTVGAHACVVPCLIFCRPALFFLFSPMIRVVGRHGFWLYRAREFTSCIFAYYYYNSLSLLVPAVLLYQCLDGWLCRCASLVPVLFGVYALRGCGPQRWEFNTFQFGS